jgi:hypothetical protein
MSLNLNPTAQMVEVEVFVGGGGKRASAVFFLIASSNRDVDGWASTGLRPPVLTLFTIRKYRVVTGRHV